MRTKVTASIIMLTISIAVQAKPEKITVTGVVEQYKAWTEITDNNGSVMLPLGGKEEKKLLKKCKVGVMCEVTAIVDDAVDDADDAAKVLDAKRVK